MIKLDFKMKKEQCFGFFKMCIYIQYYINKNIIYVYIFPLVVPRVDSVLLLRNYNMFYFINCTYDKETLHV